MMHDLDAKRTRLILLCADLKKVFPNKTNSLMHRHTDLAAIITEIQSESLQIIDEHSAMSENFDGIATAWTRLHALLERWVMTSGQSLKIPTLELLEGPHPAYEKTCMAHIQTLERNVAKEKNATLQQQKEETLNRFKEFISSVIVINAHLRLVSEHGDTIRTRCLEAYTEFLKTNTEFNTRTIAEMRALEDQMAALMEEFHLVTPTTPTTNQAPINAPTRGIIARFFLAIGHFIWALLRYPLQLFADPAERPEHRRRSQESSTRTADTVSQRPNSAAVVPRPSRKPAAPTSITPRSTEQSHSETLSV